MVNFILSILSIVIVITGFICMKKEKELSGFYRAMGICGRIKAFITGYLILSGVLVPLYGIILFVAKLLGAVVPYSWFDFLFYLLAIVFLPLGLLMYRGIKNKCPEELKKGLLKDILIISWGITMRFSLILLMFFIKSWWKLVKPREYVLEDGRAVWVYPGDDKVYSEGSATCIGHVDPTNSNKVILNR